MKDTDEDDPSTGDALGLSQAVATSPRGSIVIAKSSAYCNRSHRVTDVGAHIEKNEEGGAPNEGTGGTGVLPAPNSSGHNCRDGLEQKNLEVQTHSRRCLWRCRLELLVLNSRPAAFRRQEVRGLLGLKLSVRCGLRSRP